MKREKHRSQHSQSDRVRPLLSPSIAPNVGLGLAFAEGSKHIEKKELVG